jgi:hypothetical protein
MSIVIPHEVLKLDRRQDLTDVVPVKSHHIPRRQILRLIYRHANDLNSPRTVV